MRPWLELLGAGLVVGGSLVVIGSLGRWVAACAVWWWDHGRW